MPDNRSAQPGAAEPSGLSAAEAARRLAADGFNELPQHTRSPLLGLLAEVVREPMFLLLLAAGGIYLLLGDIGEALLLLGFVLVVIAITVVQTRRTERVLAALRDLSSPRALVIRDGLQQRIAGREVVRGDLLVLTEGDRVPADAVVLAANDLMADESLLTGESVPVRKRALGDTPPPTGPGGDDQPCVWSGTLLVRGRAQAEVRATGPRSELGKIGQSLTALAPEPTPLQRDTARLVRRLALVGLALCALVVVLHGLGGRGWLAGVLAGITLAMATLPEEFPVVLTVFMALGAWRLSQRRVLTRHMPTIETLGQTTVLCVDKTGTLTKNRMTVAVLEVDGERFAPPAAGDTLPERFHSLAEYAILASELAPFDPMERALRALGQRFLHHTGHLHPDWTLAHEYEIGGELLAMSHVWRDPREPVHVVAAKGAAEAIAELCHLDVATRTAWLGRAERMATEGLRVLAVARGVYRGDTWPASQHDFDFAPVGLIGLHDPVRTQVPAALAECYAAGLRVLMITGDHPATACAVARQIGLTPAEAVLTGDELDQMTDDALAERVAAVSIYARMRPQHKLRLVQALRARGEVVAMTGDGVNDAPALKASHIGVAMGSRGTDVAREAADLVLLDDDFAALVAAIRTGRRIFDNLRKSMAYILAVHVPIAGLALLPLLLGWPLALLPVHVVFLELIIDPACSLVFEAEAGDPDLMTRPPRDPHEALFGRFALGVAALQGLIALAMVAGIYGSALQTGLSADAARTSAFLTLVAANLALIFANRSWTQGPLAVLHRRNPVLGWVFLGAGGALALTLALPQARGFFQFDLPPAPVIVGAIAAGLASQLWFEALKRSAWWRRRAGS